MEQDVAAGSVPWGVDVLLRDGSTARLRTIGADDGPLVEALHTRLSAESIRLRFFAAHPALSKDEVQRLTEHRDPDHLALVAERGDSLVAVAQYDREPGQDEAEVAFVVDDAYQGLGLGTLLLEHLAAAGRSHGIRRFVAVTLGENRAMLDVFRHAGFAPRMTRAEGEVHVVLDIEPSRAATEAAEERDRAAVVNSMARLLRPGSIAVVGAGRQPGKIGHEILHNLLSSGFTGPLYPVNPSARSVAGVPCLASVDDLPDGVDLGVIAVPAQEVPKVVEACGRRGVGGLVVVTAGFAETGGEGANVQREIVRLAHAHGMRLIGPNCFGIINTDPEVSMNATFSADLPVRGSIGFASQSGGLGIAILAEAAKRGIGLSSFVSMGNKGDVSGNDLITWWEQDEATDVILLYLESFGNPTRFNRIARRVGRTKPIVAVKAGRSHAGTRAASSHTAAMASSESAVEALCAQAGVVRVDTIEELFDVAEVLDHQPVPAGHRVGVVSNAGGPGVLAADACVASHLEVPELSEPVQAALRAVLPPGAGVANPVDLIASASPEQYRRAVEILSASGEVDSIVVIFTPPLVTTAQGVAAALRDAADGAEGPAKGIPIVASFLGPTEGTAPLRDALRPIPCFTYPETAVRALAPAVRYGVWQAQPVGQVPELDTDPNEARRRVAAALEDQGGTGWLTGSAALSILEAYGIPTVPTTAAQDATRAADAAEAAGFPVVLKAEGPDLVHKTELGAVRLGLRNPDEVAAAFGAMASALGAAMRGAIVQPMVSGGVETIVGFARDPSFGALVLFGLGGTAAELLGDHVERLTPLTDLDAAEMVRAIRGAPLLTGYRGSEPVDVEGVTQLVLRLARLADDLPELAEADCNPVIVTPRGPVVVDARIRVAPPVRTDDARHLA
jgi:acetate---CoA ligase (ADP-forming)